MSVNEKDSLPTPIQGQNTGPQSNRRRFTKVVVLGSIAVVLIRALTCLVQCCRERFDSGVLNLNAEPSCPQVNALVPEKNNEVWESVGSKIGTDEFKTAAINWLAGAVRVPTESYDNMDPVGVDPRWETFGAFHEYLLKAFPKVHDTLKLAKVNTYGLLYEWTGSDTSLKPVLLAAHQGEINLLFDTWPSHGIDVVPVDPNTVDQWEHPPYSGYYDGKSIWGRGSSDDKSGLIGALSAIETLIDHGFKPTRTVVLAFGFDEETSGLQGASELGEAMLDVYGEDAFLLIVDEGGGFTEQYGTIFATPGIAEKGYLDTRIEVASAGGHSSVPPSHTSIGILSALLVHLENHPYPVHLSREQPIYETLQCYAEHAEDLDHGLRKAIKKSARSKMALHAAERMLFKNLAYKALWGTTQAIDLIGGGVKTNALPENAWAVVNHRIATTSSVEETQARDTQVLKHLAHKFNLTYTAFGTSITDDLAAPSKGSLVLSDAWGNSLAPAPVTPTKGKEAAPYQLLSGTIKATYNAHRSLTGNNIFVAPGMSTGNTDTRYYWKLSSHIFRYNHKNTGSSSNRLKGVHTVNESIPVDTFLEVIRFFTTLILNADESNLS